MCAIRRISNRLSREWKLKRAVMDISGNKVKYALILSHKGKNNTSFGTVKGLLLFVCTPNMNKILCFCKIKKTNRMRFLPSLSWAGTLNKNETKTWWIYCIYWKLQMTAKPNNSKQKQKLFYYVISKDGRFRIVNFIFATLTQTTLVY